MGELTSRESKQVFCHFSFKRPKGSDYGLFAVAFYRDFDGKQLILHRTRRYKLWENHQFITAIQSYQNALQNIYEYQGMMKAANINQVYLVTDNSILAGWIENPKKNKQYQSYMEKAVEPYSTGSYKEIVLGVGLCDTRKSEKAYKYCKEEFLEETNEKFIEADNGENKIVLGEEYKSVLDIIEEGKPKISGIKQL